MRADFTAHLSLLKHRGLLHRPTDLSVVLSCHELQLLSGSAQSLGSTFQYAQSVGVAVLLMLSVSSVAVTSATSADAVQALQLPCVQFYRQITMNNAPKGMISEHQMVPIAQDHHEQCTKGHHL